MTALKLFDLVGILIINEGYKLSYEITDCKCSLQTKVFDDKNNYQIFFFLVI